MHIVGASRPPQFLNPIGPARFESPNGMLLSLQRRRHPRPMKKCWISLLSIAGSTVLGPAYRAGNLQRIKALLLPDATAVKPMPSIRYC
jgi:hypothetical protein